MRIPLRGACSLIVLVLATILLGSLNPAAATTPRVRLANGVTQPQFSYADAIRETVYVQ